MFRPTRAQPSALSPQPSALNPQPSSLTRLQKRSLDPCHPHPHAAEVPRPKSRVLGFRTEGSPPMQWGVQLLGDFIISHKQRMEAGALFLPVAERAPNPRALHRNVLASLKEACHSGSELCPLPRSPHVGLRPDAKVSTTKPLPPVRNSGLVVDLTNSAPPPKP